MKASQIEVYVEAGQTRAFALAHVEATFSKPGTQVYIEVTVEHRRKQALARVASLPFFNPERKRK